MLETLTCAAEQTSARTVWDDVIIACNRIPPLWDLRNYIAVNPFLGFSDHGIDVAAALVGDGLEATVLPGPDYFRSHWMAGTFDAADLTSAARRAGVDAGAMQAVLTGRADVPTRVKSPIETLAERFDREHLTDWNGGVLRSTARWCAVHATNGGRYWRPLTDQRLFASWREAAGADPSLDIAGLRGFRAWARSIPSDHAPDAIVWALDQVSAGESDLVPYFYRLLGGVYGWASYLRRTSWERGRRDPGALVDLLAMRVCMDAGVHLLARRRPSNGMPSPRRTTVADESALLVFQNALEDGFARRLLGSMKRPPTSVSAVRPKVEAVFCIDVRSEPLRRHLEAQSPEIRTRGFAGFFGVAMSWRSRDGESARCPALISPSLRLGPTCLERNGVSKTALPHMQSAPAASFSYVEILGMLYGLALAKDAAACSSPGVASECDDPLELASDDVGGGIPPGAGLDLAASILKNVGLRSSFARIVLLCGHEGHSANNPHEAGLHCGACGGHSGAINARVAAALLNDPEIRAGLTGRGWTVPDDTHFLPAVHDTSTDEVRLLDTDRVPAGHGAEIATLKAWLERAGALTRRERAGALGLGEKPGGVLARLLRRRARDWSEVRPEWALARNAAFIAARRSRTRGIDLKGRAFLHEYDAAADSDDSTLALILSAPMVVASWINLQYFASTVDNEVFGCGDKALHNRVGTLGVVLGNGGDLRTGLPLQSVHSADGQWFHEPLRLQVVVEASTEKIDRVLEGQPEVMDLVKNGWVRLFAVSPDGLDASRWVARDGWERVDVTRT